MTELCDNETIGICEGLCGGLLSHHLVDGLCPACRESRHIADYVNHDGPVALGVEAGVTIHDADWRGR